MREYKKIMCIDVEATCWPDRSKGRLNDIIEIGIQQVDIESKELVGEAVSILVFPTQSEISEFCTNLTTITPEMVEMAMDFPDAIKFFVDTLHPEKCIFASWGAYDKNQFERQCKREGVSYPFTTHLNVKELFAATYGYTGALDEMAEEVGLTFEGTHHRGMDDARMVARILLKLLK